MKYTILFFVFLVIAARGAMASSDYDDIAFTNPAYHSVAQVGDMTDDDWFRAKVHERLFWEYNEIRTIALTAEDKGVIRESLCTSADGLSGKDEWRAKKDFKATPAPALTSKILHLRKMLGLAAISLTYDIQDKKIRAAELRSMREQMSIIEKNCFDKAAGKAFDTKAVLSALGQLRQDVNKSWTAVLVAEKGLEARYFAKLAGVAITTEKAQLKEAPMSDAAMDLTYGRKNDFIEPHDDIANYSK